MIRDRFRTITKTYYRGSHVHILVYNLSDIESLKALIPFINDIKEYSTPKFLIGTHKDKTNMYHQNEIDDFASKYNLVSFELDAHDRNDCISVFEGMQRLIPGWNHGRFERLERGLPLRDRSFPRSMDVSFSFSHLPPRCTVCDVNDMGVFCEGCAINMCKECCHRMHQSEQRKFHIIHDGVRLFPCPIHNGREMTRSKGFADGFKCPECPDFDFFTDLTEMEKDLVKTVHNRDTSMIKLFEEMKRWKDQLVDQKQSTLQKMIELCLQFQTSMDESNRMINWMEFYKNNQLQIAEPTMIMFIQTFNTMFDKRKNIPISPDFEKFVKCLDQVCENLKSSSIM